MSDNDVDTFTQILESLRDVDTKLDFLLKGGKLHLDPNDDLDALWIDQINAFYPDEFEKTYDRNLDSKPEMYYITPEQRDAGHDDVIEEADTSVHPLHTNLVVASEVFLRGCSYSNIQNVVVAGADPHFRDPRHLQGFLDRSENIFLHEKGDLVSLSQSVKAMIGVMEGTDATPRSIFIDNTTDRFTPFLKMADLFYEEGIDWLNDEFERRGMASRFAVVEVAKTGIAKVAALGQDVERPLQSLPMLYQNLFFETSSEEKEHDVQDVVREMRLDLRVQHANTLLGHSEHAPEWTWSFGGNCLDKMYLTLRDKLAEPTLDEDLAKMGLTRETAFIMVADGGESVADERIRDTMVMEPIRHLTHPYSEYPGSETKPVAQRQGSKEDGYHNLDVAFREIGGNADRRFADNCVIMIAPLAQEDPENPVYFAFKNKARMEYVFEPRPSYHLHKTQRHYQKPEGYTKTVAELSEEGDKWMIEGLAISGAVKLAARAGNVPKLPLDVKRDFMGKKDIEVSAAWPLEEEKDIEGKMRNHDLQVLTSQPVASFDEVRRFMRNSDSYLFAQSPEAEGENFWMSRVFLPSSIFVAKQLRDPYVNGNPMVIFAPEGEERPPVEQIFDHLKRAAMVTQDPHYLYNRASKLRSASDFIKRMSMIHLEQNEKEDIPYKPLPETGQEMVTFLLSASSSNPLDNDDAYSAAVNWGLNGYGLMSGMGASNPMGWHVFGGLQLIREGYDVTVQGVQDPYAMKTEGWPIQEMEKFMGSGHAVVAPDILVRIEQLLELEKLRENPGMQKVVVCQANGIGGLQEVAGVLALKEAGVQGMENVHMIIQNNRRQTPGQGMIGPHDALIDLLEHRDEMHNVYICSSVRDMMQCASEITGKPMTYYHVVRPQDTQFPFEPAKHDYYDWFMGDDQNSQRPITTIRDVVEGRGWQPICYGKD